MSTVPGRLEPRTDSSSASDRPLRVLHVITGLGRGGAEAGLVALVGALGQHRHAVISLAATTDRLAELDSLGVPVTVLGMRRASISIPALARARAIARRFEPDVVQSWMPHADLFASLLVPGLPHVWGLHAAQLATHEERRATRLLRSVVNARISRFQPDAIVACSESTARWHVGIGYRSDRMVVVPNGCDTTHFRRDAAAGRALRPSLGFDDGRPVVGMLGRWHPQKDIGNFVAAVSRLHARGCRVHAVLAGEGLSPENNALRELIEAAGLSGHVSLLGPRTDVQPLLNALDLFMLSSLAEGLPYAVLEAMACERLCAVTDVGDLAAVVGSAGRVVPARDPRALAEAAYSLLELPEAGRDALGRAARQRIVDGYGVARMADGYDRVWRQTIARGVHDD